jgi:hypothetical protein
MTDPQNVNLNVSDIADAVKVIDFACEQGAFRGWETIRQVHGVRERLGAFVDAANAITTAAPEPALEVETIPDDGESEEALEPADTEPSALPPRRARRAHRTQ